VALVNCRRSVRKLPTNRIVSGVVAAQPIIAYAATADMSDNAIAHAVQKQSIAWGRGAHIANAQKHVAQERNIEPIQSQKMKIVAVPRVRIQTAKNNIKIAT
jgi:hypothetical protein